MWRDFHALTELLTHYVGARCGTQCAVEDARAIVEETLHVLIPPSFLRLRHQEQLPVDTLMSLLADRVLDYLADDRPPTLDKQNPVYTSRFSRTDIEITTTIFGPEMTPQKYRSVLRTMREMGMILDYKIVTQYADLASVTGNVTAREVSLKLQKAGIQVTAEDVDITRKRFRYLIDHMEATADADT